MGHGEGLLIRGEGRRKMLGVGYIIKDSGGRGLRMRGEGRREMLGVGYVI